MNIDAKQRNKILLLLFVGVLIMVYRSMGPRSGDALAV